MKYRTIVADPPWGYDGRTAPWRSSSHASYSLMALNAICSLPVADLASPDAHLYLWAVLPMMREAYQVVDAWGFHPDTVLTWCKPGLGLGGGFRGNTEHLIVARRGLRSLNPTCDMCGGRARGARKCGCNEPAWRVNGVVIGAAGFPLRPFRSLAAGTWYRAKRQEHSRKPSLFMDLIEQMSPGPYLEMFARPPHRLGWDVWGNESANTASLEAAGG